MSLVRSSWRLSTNVRRNRKHRSSAKSNRTCSLKTRMSRCVCVADTRECACNLILCNTLRCIAAPSPTSVSVSTNVQRNRWGFSSEDVPISFGPTNQKMSRVSDRTPFRKGYVPPPSNDVTLLWWKSPPPPQNTSCLVCGEF